MLKDTHVTLRPWGEADIAALAQLRNDSNLQAQLMTEPRPNSLQRVKEWLSSKSGREDVLFFVIASPSSNEVLGYVQIVNLRPVHGTGELGICLAPSAQRKGCGRETIELLEGYLRGTFGIRKLVLNVLETNTPAVKFYQRCGFVHAGRLTRHFLSGGILRDVLIMEKHFDT